jgi:hypothetical protein
MRHLSPLGTLGIVVALLAVAAGLGLKAAAAIEDPFEQSLFLLTPHPVSPGLR